MHPSRPHHHSFIATGREAFENRSWRRACEAFESARAAGALEPGDLWRLALASFLTGRTAAFVEVSQELHHAYRALGDGRAAARTAIWLGIHLDSRGDVAQSTGWFARAQRLLEDEQGDCAERGYLLLPTSRRRLMAGDHEGACRLAAEAIALAQRFDDPELLALALYLEGCALLRGGRIQEGLARLDEAMIGVTADELSALVTGLVYCSVLGACREVWALRRVREWTERLADWCAAQPEMVAYTGECRVYGAEVRLHGGRWRDAVDEARRARERFARGSVPSAAGLAHYVEAEVRRLRGEYTAAEEGYRAASETGYVPQPGLALLRLAQGEREAALAAVRRALAETSDRSRRARLLAARIEIALETNDVADAHRACDEMAELARSCASDVIDTILAQQRGAIALADGNASEALTQLRAAWREWRSFDAPYDAARTRVLLGRACRALGDDDGATLELQAARAEFARLGARPDVARIDAMSCRQGTLDRHGLTPREREVLALVATGRTNRSIATALSISEKTVARHLANIFTKLGLSSRAAATAYAYEHHLLEGQTRRPAPRE
ncbi:MAG TPA: LuxR C-terminal-related transcriptional regulator [Gemmatimonadaceae bacterium]|nr:LuxR C-terminal-related transcriptional regulator [Gemmatimonadaceae bacterium]